MSNGPTSQPNTPGGPGHQSGPPGYPPQGHPGHPGYHPQGYFLTIIIRSKMLNFYFRLSQPPRLSTASWSISTTRYAAIWSTRLFWLSATPRLSSKSSISSISTSISRFFLEFHFSKYNDIFKVIHQEHPDHIPLAVLADQWADHQIQINRIHMERLLTVVNRYFRILNGFLTTTRW